ncbi:MAG: HD domain-containing protein [Acidobacteriota bacterium]
MPLGDRFDRALALAHRVHRHQVRKGTRVPYMAHLMAVTAITLEYGGDEDQAVAALLHDTLEDTRELAPSELRAIIRDEFGAGVLLIVEDCTDTDERPKPAWWPRKERYLLHVRGASTRSLLVSAADKLHNVQSILRDLPYHGDATFDKFSREAGKAGTLWYYRALSEVFTERLGGRLAAELARAVGELDGRS